MSYKIYDAYQIKSKDIPKIIEELYTIKKCVLQLTTNRILDFKFESEKEMNEFFLSSDWSWLKCNVMFFFYQGKHVIKFFNSKDSKPLFDALVTKYKLKDWYYQDCSDPEKLKDWNERETFWKSLDNDFGDSYEDKGLTYRIVTDMDIPYFKRKVILADTFKEPEKRIKSILRDFFKSLIGLYGN